MKKFSESEVSRNVIGFDSQCFSVPELGTGQVGQLEIRLTCQHHQCHHQHQVCTNVTGVHAASF